MRFAKALRPDHRSQVIDISRDAGIRKGRHARKTVVKQDRDSIEAFLKESVDIYKDVTPEKLTIRQRAITQLPGLMGSNPYLFEMITGDSKLVAFIVDNEDAFNAVKDHKEEEDLCQVFGIVKMDE